MAIALISLTGASGGNATAVTTFTITKPTTLVDAAVMFLAIADNNGTATWVQAKNTDAGPLWTRLGVGEDNATVNVGLSVFRRVVTTAASEAASYAFSNVNNTDDTTTVSVAYSWCLIGLSGVDTTTPEDVALPAFTGSASTASPPVTAVTPVTAGAWVIAMAASDQTSTAIWTVPTGYSNLTSNNTGRGVALASIAWSGSGAQPATTFGVGGGAPSVGIQLAVRPAGAAAPFRATPDPIFVQRRL